MIRSKSKLDDEIKFISMILCNNGFPLNVMQTIFMNKIIDSNKIKPASSKNIPCLSWLDGVGERFAWQISQAVQKCYFSVNVRAVFNIKPILPSIRKDVLSPFPSY